MKHPKGSIGIRKWGLILENKSSKTRLEFKAGLCMIRWIENLHEKTGWDDGDMDAKKRNFILMFIDPIVFTIGMTFLSVNAVMTYFLSNLGASTFEIGLANALVSIGAFVSQPIFAKKVMNLPYKLKTFVKLLFAQRIFFLAFILTIPFFSVSHPHFMVMLFLICWLGFNFFVGSYGPFYMSLFVKMIAVQQRGRLKGYSGGIGNLLGLGIAYLIGILLADIKFPYNYTVVFAIGIILLLIDVFVFALMKELPDQITKININYFQYYKSIPKNFSDNPTFKKIVIAFSFMIISQVSLAYYTLYAVRDFAANSMQIALFTGLAGLVNFLGNICFGILADKRSHRFVLIAASACGAFAGIFALTIHQLWAVFVAFALTNVCLTGYNLSNGILIIETVTKEKLPMCISINTVITLIVSSIVTIGSSFLIDTFSFSIVFLITAIAGIIGCVVLYSYDSSRIRIRSNTM
ncbi:MFS transporter [Fodinisporobacter ferrooxydans]|uniref:MFS transporter n=1 Tax=Fodinisporobacter ferrooxydans TaxID=2901836 RepID=A0ABY4CE15_9BACL|nr:MFS transporter [Alicyclobacillaceae bacterium MYW30-H2]